MADDLRLEAKAANLLALAESDTTLKKAGVGEWAGPCPSCGGKDRFSVRQMDDGWVWVCRGCSDGKYHDTIDYMKHFRGLAFKEALAYLTGKSTRPAPVAIRHIEKPQTPRIAPDWFGKDARWYKECFVDGLPLSAMWATYKTMSDSQINERGLGFGKLPSSQCRHDRLILPVFDNGRLVNLRGRRIGCDCPKWLASGGWTLQQLPLYNGSAVHDGGVVLVLESPVDAIQATGLAVWPMIRPQVGKRYDILEALGKAADEGLPPIVGVATYSTSYWRPEWTERVRKATAVVVCFDNDLAGNGGASKRSRMVSERKGKPIPQARGIKLVNDLLEDGINAILFDWQDSPAKQDVGSWL